MAICLANLALTHPMESCTERQHLEEALQRREVTQTQRLNSSVSFCYFTYHSKSTVHEEHEVRAGKQKLHIDLLKRTDAACPIFGQVSDQLLNVCRVVRGESLRSRHAGRQGMPCAKGVQQSTCCYYYQLQGQRQCQRLPQSAATDRKTSHTCLHTLV